jgi:hypothetical protein
MSNGVQVLVGALGAAAVFGVVWLVVSWLDRAAARRMLTSRTRRTVLVHRTGGRPTLRGMVREEAADGLVLAHASLLMEPARAGDPTPEPVALAGDVLIRWGTVDMVQDPRDSEHSTRPGRQAPLPHQASSVRSAWDAAPADPRPLREVR